MKTESIQRIAAPVPVVTGIGTGTGAGTGTEFDAAATRDPVPRAEPQPAEPSTAAADDAAATQAAAQANKALAESGRELAFEFNNDLRRMVFTIVDTRTKEVVRQVPSEQAIAIARALSNGTAKGAIVTTRA